MRTLHRGPGAGVLDGLAAPLEVADPSDPPHGVALAAKLDEPSPPDQLDLPDLPLVLPDLPWQPTAMQLFMFSAATWNRHRIHYERDAARAEGHGDVVVQRALIGNVFARHVAAWLGGQGHLQRLAWRVLASALPGQRLRCQGAVTGRIADPITNPITDSRIKPTTGRITSRMEPPDHPYGTHPDTLPPPLKLMTDGQGTRLRYEARLTRLDDGVDIALAEGTLCIRATR